MDELKDRRWWKAAGTRAIKTAAQTAVSTIGTTAVVLGDVAWPVVGGASGLAAVLSLLTSLAGLPEVTEATTERAAETISEVNAKMGGE